MNAFLEGRQTLREVFGLAPAAIQKLAADAHRWLVIGQLDHARTAFEGLIALEPRVAYFWSSLAAVDLAEHRHADAFERALYALALDPNDAHAQRVRDEARTHLPRA